MNLIAANDLAKNFGGRTLFEHVSFGIDEGARTGLVGPNGAGKSTLLKILAGTSTPDQGRVARKKGLRLGYLEQTPQFPAGIRLYDAVTSLAEDAHEAQAPALTWMAQLDLNRFGDDFPVEQLSGGWLKRVALARELVREPEILFLDEPTNHLDVSGILWLEEFLASAPFAILMITHDRLFLRRVVNQVLDLDPRNPHYLLNVKGDYIQYLETKEHELAALQRQERVLKNDLRRERDWLSRGAQARQTKQRARQQSAEVLANTVDDLRTKNATKRVQIEFAENSHAPTKLIEAIDVAKSFGDGPDIFSKLNLLITPKTRLALLGDNGSGKSTLVRVLLGHEAPTRGQVRLANQLKIAYFEQGRETLQPELSVLKNICPEGDYVSFAGQFIHVRSYLDRFLFQGSKAELPVSRLSGGEQARLRIAQLMLTEAQVLVLDEPTNDLDADTLDTLAEALDQFPGAVILVTHDRYFMDRVANQILAIPSLEKFADYFQWEAWNSQKMAPQKPIEPSGSANSSATTVTATSKTKLSYKEKFELENMEATILKLEQEMETLNNESTTAIADHVRLAAIHSRLAEVQNELDLKFERWSILEAKAKGSRV